MQINKILFAIIATIFLTSCEKRTGRSFIHNDTNQNVTVIYGFKTWEDSPSTIHIESGQEYEIPDIDHWSITQHTTNDSVVFLFDDSTRVVHSYKLVIDSLGNGHEIFNPILYNILSNSFDPNPSWTEKNTSGNKWRNDYYIRR